MTDTATPEAADSPRFSAEKDRSCPFCDTKFTSSSLGRHLDLYIKERNPKAPDGIHDVEEIRKLRGNVTRRQVKLSTSKREGSTPTSSKPNSSRGQRSPSASTSTIPKQRTGGTANLGINKHNWTTTGVINDIPAAVENSANDHGKRRDSTRKVSVKDELIRKHMALEERDRARAAELALRDVLGSIKAANMRAHPQSPFDFNLFSLSFPGMCLRCLSAPPALSFGSTISKERSWSVEPPGSYHLDALGRWLDTKMRDWRISRQRNFRLGINKGHEGAKGREDQGSPWSHSDPDADYYEANCMKHIHASYNTWENLSKEQKQEEWHKECVSALTQEQDKHRETRGRMERLEREVQSLQAELNAQNDPEHGSVSVPLSPRTARETLNHGPDSATWDYDALITKWRTRIQQERSQQHPLPGPPTPWSAPTPDIAQTPSYSNGNHAAKFEHRPSINDYGNHVTNGVGDDEDLVDAPGEEDDMVVDTADAGHGLLDPKLRQRENGHEDSAIENGNPQGKG